MKEFKHIQSKESIIKTIDKFCLTTAIISWISVPLYLVMGIYEISAMVGVVGCMFWAIRHYNKLGHHNFARFSIILVTILGVLGFSLFLGFNTGIVFYIFASPHLIYLLFDFRKKLPIYITMGIYILTFLLTFILDDYNLITKLEIENNLKTLMYGYNFVFSMIFSYILITIFAKNNDNYIKLIEKANKQLNIEIEQKNKMNEKLEETLKEKDILLAEVHHRVKNNLSYISGLLELQNFYVKDNKLSNILNDTSARIKSIALLHEKFYEQNTIEKIDMRSFLNILIEHINICYDNKFNTIKIHTEIENVSLTMTEALPFSLLINELLTNSYKHAFSNKESGNIYINLTENEKEVTLQYKDDGIGFDIEKDIKDNSLGMNLIDAFTMQLKGKKAFTSTTNLGCSFTLQFFQK